MPRRFTYVTGTRADFGVIAPTLRRIARTPGLELNLVVTGMHLSDRFGRTEAEVEASGIPIAARIEVPVDDDSGHGMALSAAAVVSGVADYLSNNPRDALLVLGDRGEMLAAATAALFMGTPIIHLCGGERSGSIDESIRHSISKLAHIHLVAAEDGERRLLGMGEEPWRVHRIGAPGLVGLQVLADVPIETLAGRYGFDASLPYALLLFHPVVQDAEAGGEQVSLLLERLTDRGLQVVCLLPNADHGNTFIRNRIEAWSTHDLVSVVDHMPREDYVSAMARAAILIGNSSSGIVEAASFGTAVVNCGDRQKDRLRNPNIFDSRIDHTCLDEAIERALAFDASSLINVYGDGQADRRVAELLLSIDFDDARLLKKSMTY
jgi:UDP-hydrolysing UDP-N-acetyl-D-glucosamine 2-epimerase